MSFDKIWTDEMVADLPEMVNAGLQRRQIVEQIYIRFGVDVSVNALTGKMYRLGLKCLPATKETAKPSSRPIAKPRGAPIAKPATIVLVRQRAQTPETDVYSMFKTRCQFIFNEDPRRPIFCTEPRDFGSPYCAEHHALCHKPVSDAAAE